MEDVVGSAATVAELRALVEPDPAGTAPNIMLVGDPGVGKTSALHAAANHVLGPRAADALLVLDGSGRDRTADVVPKTIAEFANRSFALPRGVRPIALIDEADGMEPDAMRALAGMIKATPNVRFFLACNSATNIPESLMSACARVYIPAIDPPTMLERLLHVAKQENADVTPAGLELLIYNSRGDMRTALNDMQAVASSSIDGVTKENVARHNPRPDPLALSRIVILCARSSTKKPTPGSGVAPPDQVRAALLIARGLYERTHDPLEIVEGLLHAARIVPGVPDAHRSAMVCKLAASYSRMAECAPTRLQLEAAVAALSIIEPPAP